MSKLRGLILVTEEGSSQNPARRPHIPDVCRLEGVSCISLLQMIRAEGWRF